MYQMSLTDCFDNLYTDPKLKNQKKIEYGFRGCRACRWFQEKEQRCLWAIYASRPGKPQKNYIYPGCDGDNHFYPSAYAIPGMCENCKYSNQFHFQYKNKYKEEREKHNGYSREGTADPIEEPNIYCTHREGSLNRRTEYKDCEWEGFGTCHWDRQHEFDTCDRWDPDDWHLKKEQNNDS